MEHIKFTCTLKFQLFFDFICSIRLHFRNQDFYKKDGKTMIPVMRIEMDQNRPMGHNDSIHPGQDDALIHYTMHILSFLSVIF